MKKLTALADGSTIGLLVTGSALSPERWEKGLRTLEKLGFKWKSPIDPTAAYGKNDHGFASASAMDRTKALYELLQDSSVGALLAVRGAYGSLDILPRLDMEHVRASGKTLIGFSDVSVLLQQFAFRAQIPAIHGAVLGSSFADYESDESAKESVSLLFRLLQDPSYRFSQSLTPVREGHARGRLIVSNLTMLLSLLGTPWDIDFQGAILVLEEVGDAPFRVHRALTQLKLAGKFDKIAGVIFARFSKCVAPHGPTIEDVFQLFAKEMTANSKFPILSGLELGHWGMNVPLPIGCLAEIDGARFAVAESPLADKV